MPSAAPRSSRDRDFIEEAKLWRARLGGLMVQPWPMICDTLRLLSTRLTQMPTFVAHAQAMAQALATLPNLHIHPNPPQVNMFHIHLPCSAANARLARDHAAQTTGVWLANGFWEEPGQPGCALEFTVGEKALALDLSQLVDAVTALLDHL